MFRQDSGRRYQVPYKLIVIESVCLCMYLLFSWANGQTNGLGIDFSSSMLQTIMSIFCQGGGLNR